jgi:hypothetical protein
MRRLHYLGYETSTGRILYTGDIQEWDDSQPLSVIAQPGQTVMEIASDVELKDRYVRAGKLVAMPPQPTEFHEFDYAAGRWTCSEAAMNQAREQALAMVDTVAEQARDRHTTHGAGQAEEYEATFREATAYLDGLVNDLPFLQATVDAGYAKDLGEAARAVIHAHDARQVRLAQIRQLRLSAKHDIRTASTPEQIRDLRDLALARLSKL